MPKCRLLLLISVIAVISIGCDRSPRGSSTEATGDAAVAQSGPLRVVVLGSEELATAIRREWRAQSQQEFELEYRESEDGKLGQRPISADVVVFPSRQLGQLVNDRQIIPWPEQSVGESNLDDYGWNDLFSAQRRQTIRWGDQKYGVTFGEPSLVLLYRKDLFDAWGLTPPATWEEYSKLQSEIASRTAESSELAVSIEPLATGSSGVLLLARAAAYVRYPNQYSAMFRIGSMDPLINQPPFVRALEELISSKAYQPNSADSLSPNGIVERMIQGDVVMGIGQPSAAGTDAEPPGQVTFAMAPLPGSVETYQFSKSSWQPRPDNSAASSVPLLGAAGYMGSVVRGSSAAAAARDFLIWVTRDEQAMRISRQSIMTGPSRTSQVTQASQWVEPSLSSAAGQYTEALTAAQATSNALRLLRIPEQHAYLAALDHAVKAAVAGDLGAQEALDQVATEWSKITESAGRKEQQAAYRASLGL